MQTKRLSRKLRNEWKNDIEYTYIITSKMAFELKRLLMQGLEK